MIPTPYCIYLRKSRADLEAEAHGEGESLSRHEAALMALAKSRRLTVTKIFREIVSGETITARPEMQALLREVEAGLWEGVLVMEIERLSRGDTIDQGIVYRAFSYSGTLIVTPSKTYDPNDEFDQEFFEFGLFMSRREYKTINRRMQRGRLSSVKEGKFAGNKAPYGYARVKLPKEKGWILQPDEHADVVRKIFAWFTDPVSPIGSSLIVRRLNDAGIPSPSGDFWTPAAVLSLLKNPVYCGFLRWGWRATVKSIQDGLVTVSRPVAKDNTLFRGLHEPLVTKEQFDAAQEILARWKGIPGPKRPLQNPLSGIVCCADCGRTMVRRPYTNSRSSPSLICPYTACHNVSSVLDVVEARLLDGLRDLLRSLELKEPDNYLASSRADLLEQQASLDRQLSRVDAQISRAYELVEQGIYSSDVFLQRSAELATRQKDLLAKSAALSRRIDEVTQSIQQQSLLVPQLRHVLDVYPSSSPEEKNALLKSVLVKAYYKKTTDLRNKSIEDDMTLSLVPRLPASSSQV